MTVNDGTAQNLVIGYAGVNYNVAINSSNNTLAGVAAAINADTTLSAKVSASIVNVAAEGAAASYKIILTGKDTGFSNTISIDASALTGGTQALGATSQLNAAQDAELVVNGLTIFRSTNSITDVIPGVTLNLVGPGTTQLTVAKDTETIKENIEEFVGAYNDLVAFIRNQQKYEKDKAKNPLFGEFTLTAARAELPNILSSVQNLAKPDYANLGLIGVSIKSDGTIEIDEDRLDEVLSADPSAVGTLFVTGDGTNDGVAVQIDDFIEGFVSGVGENEAVLKSAKDAINNSITQINAQLLRVEDRLTRLSDQLNKRYSDLETTLGRLQSQLSYIGQLQF